MYVQIYFIYQMEDNMIIGIPKEIMEHENRVAATPTTVKKYVQNGHQVMVEAGAGAASYFSDEEYQAAGAKLITDVEEIFQTADLILKVKEPLFNHQKGKHEVDMMKKGQYLITFLHPASPVNHRMVTKLAEKGVIGLTLDGIPRISRAQSMDALTSMSTCAGYKGMIMAVNELAKFVPQIFSAVGMIRPANVLVIGTGVAGLQAIATGKRLGAVVHSLDIRGEANEQAQSLGAKVIDLKFPKDVVEGRGGYAKDLSGEWLQKERDALKEVIGKMDIIFLSALVPGHVAPILITDEMLEMMNPGSVIVDISIDQGGNCSGTVPGEIATVKGVKIIGIKNIPGYLPSSSTLMFAENVYNLVNYLVKDNRVVLDMDDEITSSILVTDGKRIVHEGTIDAMKRFH
jgi:NAD(P) transhydrogenase subunit alpha